MTSAAFTDSHAALHALTAGNATITLVSEATGTRYTYKVKAAKDKDTLWFVSLLTGPNNETDFNYIGIITEADGRYSFRTTAKSRLTADSAPVKAIAWTVANIQGDSMPRALQVWHEGCCCRCGRKLTVPSSIASGLGPECIKLAA